MHSNAGVGSKTVARKVGGAHSMRQILPYAERETMIARGELYSASLDPVVGSEQGGYAQYSLYKTMWGTAIVPR